jgi:hypothetical protein
MHSLGNLEDFEISCIYNSQKDRQRIIESVEFFNFVKDKISSRPFFKEKNRGKLMNLLVTQTFTNKKLLEKMLFKYLKTNLHTVIQHETELKNLIDL